uniref:Uncharacterized protein n=1 Tax=Panagrolaimus sp. PS1159 TaxID=55785 RepID=A0AC35GMQ1_9BILA
MPPRRSRSAEQEKTLIFLNILKDFYPRIVQSDDEIPIWEEVLEECQKQGIFMDKSAEYLAKIRWPASIGIVNKFTRTKRGPLSEKDQLIVQIERHRTPDFVYGRLDGDDRANLPAIRAASRHVQNDNIGDDDQIGDVSSQQPLSNGTFASSNAGNQSDVSDTSFSDNPTSSSRINKDARPEAADEAGTNNASTQPASINEIINEPNQDLRNKYYESAIRAFNICSELAEAKLQMMRSRKTLIDQ